MEKDFIFTTFKKKLDGDVERFAVHSGFSSTLLTPFTKWN